MLFRFIKKRRYWPNHIKGVEYQAHFENKPFGRQDTLPGVFSNILFRIDGLKEPDCTMLMMCTYGSLVRLDGARENVRIVGDTRTAFNHSENIANHFQHRYEIDNHNSKRHDSNSHDGISLEKSWKTIRWSIGGFFL